MNRTANYKTVQCSKCDNKLEMVDTKCLWCETDFKWAEPMVKFCDDCYKKIVSCRDVCKNNPESFVKSLELVLNNVRVEEAIKILEDN